MSESFFDHLAHAAPALQLQHLSTGYWMSQAIAILADLGVADLMSDVPTPVSDLAKQTGVHTPALYRLMRATASVGLFHEGEPGNFTLTSVGALLREDHPVSMRAQVRRPLDEEDWRTCGSLRLSVQNGRPAFDQLYGMGIFAYRGQHPAAQAAFNAAMDSHSATVGAAVLATYDFSGVSTVVDVGGGRGVFLSAILQAYPGMAGVLFDLPVVTDEARPLVAALELEARCAIQGGDMFQAVPTGGDAYLLSWIIHDWDDDHALAILRNCRRAMNPDAKLLLIETVLPDGDLPHSAKIGDLRMLAMTGGQERTDREYRSLCQAAGFRVTKILDTRSPRSIIEAEPV